MSTALILGAGFSCAAGLPLTRDLFDCKELPLSKSDEDLGALKEVADAYHNWRSLNPIDNAETWLSALSEEGTSRLLGTTLDNALQFALRRLVKLRNAHPEPYYHGICTPYVHPTHELFWRFITKNFDLKYIVSLNYDLLVEQALHESHQKNRSAPQCYYGGFQYDQIVRKMTNVTRKEAEQVALGHRYVLYKMHGSINWAWEHSPTIKIHDDVRAIFRRKRGWRPAVIAPIPEKNMPSEFSQIWNEAGKVLADADNWIVCGYSMPDFDLALRRFFERAVNFPAAYVVYIGSQQCSFGIQMADNA